MKTICFTIRNIDCGGGTERVGLKLANALIELGFDVSVIKDACGSRDEKEHQAGIDRMREDGAHIITTEIALFEWLKSSNHPCFREIQNLIKN